MPNEQTIQNASQGRSNPAAVLARLFDEQVARQPQGTAVTGQGGAWSYRQLADYSAGLAEQLAQTGTTGPVAIAADRGPECLGAILAVIRAGRAYLPLDPDTPLRRLRQMITDVRPTCLLAKKALDRFSTLDIPRIWLDTPAARTDVPRQPPETAGETLFQVIYTSGSTGVPKGVRIGYGSVLNRLEWMWTDYPFPDGAVMLVQKSFALVASTWELLGGLLQGVPSAHLTRDEVLDPGLFLDALLRERVTHAFLTPHLIAALLDEIEIRGNVRPALRLVTSGADSLPPELVFRFRQILPGTALLNLYGMTETASNVAAYDTANLPDRAARVPVGRPVAGARIMVLDAHGRQVPPGVRGEIHIAGRPVALGYVTDGGPAGDKFVQHKDGTILYKTGDSGRWLASGDLEILGRTDNQTKVRGFRVELEEIEAVLAKAPYVTDAGVCCPGEGILVAFVQLEEEEDLTALRAYLRDRLPDYMLPARFDIVTEVPRLANGKLDRPALVRLAGQRTETLAATKWIPPDKDHALVSEIWTQLIGWPPDSADQNFFDVGGHSLLAVRLAGRLGAAFGKRISLRNVLDLPTVGGLTTMVRAAPPAHPAAPVSGHMPDRP